MSDYAKGEMPLREAARKGGCKARDNGLDYSAIGKKGGARTRDRHGKEHYQAAGRKGGAVNTAKGSAYFQEIGRRGGAKVKALIEAGRRAEAEGR